MDVIKYQVFLRVVELGNLTRAAEELGYTQSAVSRIVADLEREWGVVLLTRSRTGVVLTPAGEELLPSPRRERNCSPGSGECATPRGS